MLTLCSFYIFKLYFQLTVECSLQFYTIICSEFVMFCVDLWYFNFFGDILYVLCHIYDQHNCKYWIYVYLYVVWHWLIKNWIELNWTNLEAFPLGIWDRIFCICTVYVVNDGVQHQTRHRVCFTLITQQMFWYKNAVSQTKLQSIRNG